MAKKTLNVVEHVADPTPEKFPATEPMSFDISKVLFEGVDLAITYGMVRETKKGYFNMTITFKGGRQVFIPVYAIKEVGRGVQARTTDPAFQHKFNTGAKADARKSVKI